jgi:hypothetical protein
MTGSELRGSWFFSHLSLQSFSDSNRIYEILEADVVGALDIVVFSGRTSEKEERNSCKIKGDLQNYIGSNQ